MAEMKGNLASGAFFGVIDFFKGALQLKKIRKSNRVNVEYVDLNGLIHTGLEAIINDERTMAIIRGINRLSIVTKIFHDAETLQAKVYVYEGNHRTIDWTDPKTYESHIELYPLKDIFETLDNPYKSKYAKEEALARFGKLKLKDIGYTIDLTSNKTIKNKNYDFAADAYLVLSKQWFSIGQKEPPILLLAIGIIGMLFGGFLSAFAIVFLWFLVEVLRIVIH